MNQYISAATIKTLRVKKELTQIQLAEKLNVSEDHIEVGNSKGIAGYYAY